jgi:thiosulfate dehydrogenase
MNKRMFSLLLVLAGLALVLVACGGKATQAPTAAPTEAPVVTEAPTAAPVALSGDALRGGKLYDNWMKELGADIPAKENPQWTAANAGDISVEKSYRCVVCHGWDYQGDHGFPGISASAGKDPNEILAVLKGSTDPNHDYSAYMDEQALTDLALYVSEQQIDTAAVLAMSGNADNGKKLFTDNCVDCHGPEAIAINFHPDNAPEYPATIANEDPLEMLGKLRFGQPGMPDMPAGVDLGLTDQDFADMLAYLKTLPQSSPVTEGGRIYDEWFAAFGVDAPEGDQPLWKTQTTNTRTGGDTWRCKECHGWDYKGVDGVYGSGSHQTGFPGILNAATMSPEDLTAWLDGTKNADHNFSSYMTADDFARLIAFIQKDVVDKSAFINADKTIVGGDAAHGKQLFDSVCKVCHGDDGKTLNFGDDAAPEYVGTVAADNPWEFFNKATVGVPGEAMPAGWNLGWTLQDIIDLMTYAQTLPTK